MTPEEAARRYGEIPGFDLVDYAEVALPLWQLSVEALSVAHRRIPPIKEFVMRSLRLGLDRRETAGFLGLGDEVVTGTITQLAADRFIRLETLSLSPEGEQVLNEELISSPVEDQFSILFDGLFRKPVIVPSEEISFPRDVASGSFVEIAPVPANKPDLAELSVPEVEKILISQSGDRADFGRTLLRLKRITRHRRLFRKAVGLVFKARRDKEVRVRFIISGVRAEDMERRFVEAGGTHRPGFLRAFSDAYASANLKKHLGADASGAILSFDEYESKQRASSFAKLKSQALSRKAALAESGDIPKTEGPSIQDLQAAAQNELKAADDLAAASVRPAAVYEQVEYLESALDRAKVRLLISTRGLAPHIVDRRLMGKIKSALARGVAVHIRMHIDAYKNAIGRERWNKPYLELEELRKQWSEALRVSLIKEARYFHVGMDDKFLLVSNRPMLSNQGRIRTFEQYTGLFIQRSDLIETYLARIDG